MAYHEGHLFGSDVLGGDDHVAFIFAVCAVEDEDKFAAL